MKYNKRIPSIRNRKTLNFLTKKKCEERVEFEQEEKKSEALVFESKRREKLKVFELFVGG